MNKAELFKRMHRAQDEKVRNCVKQHWGIYDKEYTKKTEEVLATLQQHHARCVWERGYKPKTSQIIQNRFNYDYMIDIGVASDCERSETFNQKIFPLIEELDCVLKELKEIKIKWWYKLFTFFGKR